MRYKCPPSCRYRSMNRGYYEGHMGSERKILNLLVFGLLMGYPKGRYIIAMALENNLTLINNQIDEFSFPSSMARHYPF